MPSFSPSVPSRPASRLAIFAAALIVAGAGCDLSARVGVRNPFVNLPAPEDRSAEVTAGLKRAAGLELAIRPSYLGVTGAVEELIGSGEPFAARVSAAERDALALGWSRGETKGTIASSGFDASRSLYLPAFWKEGERRADGNGVLWLSPAAWQELSEKGATDIRIGLGDGAFDAASKALQAFNAIAGRLSASASAAAPVPGSPFAAALKGESSVFPLRVDGKLERVRVVTARSWFAEFTILKNPENPLVLKVSVNPLAMEALRAFAPEGVDVQAVGYEITSVTSSTPSP